VADVLVEEVVRAQTVLKTDEVLRVVLVGDEQQPGVELAVGVQTVGVQGGSCITLVVKGIELQPSSGQPIPTPMPNEPLSSSG
jgi:hypothetical protein